MSVKLAGKHLNILPADTFLDRIYCADGDYPIAGK